RAEQICSRFVQKNRPATNFLLDKESAEDSNGTDSGGCGRSSPPKIQITVRRRPELGALERGRADPACERSERPELDSEDAFLSQRTTVDADRLGAPRPDRGLVPDR